MQGREYPCPLLVSLLLYNLFFSYLPPISLWLVPAFAACASGEHICYREMLSISQSLVESAELPSIVQCLNQILEQITQWTNKPGLPQRGVEDWCFVVAMVRRVVSVGLCIDIYCLQLSNSMQEWSKVFDILQQIPEDIALVHIEMANAYIEAILGKFVHVHQSEIRPLLHAFSAFFFLLSAYFVVLPLRDEAAISLGTSTLPMLFLASLVLTMLAAPASSYLLSYPHLPKGRALVLLYRFFGGSLIFFFLLYVMVPAPALSVATKDFSWIFTVVRASFFLWIALLNLFTISAMWARVTDIMSSEAGTRLFGFVGAGATLGQLIGSLLAVAMAHLGPVLLLVSALMMELAARCALSVGDDDLNQSSVLREESEEQQLLERAECASDEGGLTHSGSMEQNSPKPRLVNKLVAMLEGLRLIVASTYLLHICAFLWLSAVVSSFFYFEKSAVVAGIVHDPLGRRILLAEINSLTAVFILIGQLTMTGRLLTWFGITVALCALPMVAFLNLTALAASPSSAVVAISEATRKVINYVVTRPAREILFTVTTPEEKYKAKVCIDTLVQRLGDAAAAGVYKMMEGLLLEGPSAVAISALPVCVGWLWVAVSLGRRQATLAKMLETTPR